ncbi:MAG TPA: ABC transporter substrate-binding protein [candidate division Zixibacteria bacterium]|nr:ABC transporter substrate-binding protein [candidate division Zixibacteria bacterium]
MSPTRLVTFALLALLASACTSDASPSVAPPSATRPPRDLEEVRLLLGFRPDVQFAPFYLAQQAGYFADEGLEVTIEHSNDVLRLVADGQAQVGVADATDVMIARTTGIPIRYVATLYERFPVALIGRRGTLPADPAGLAGHSIGTPGRFGSSWHALLAMLDAGGLTPDDVTIREYPQFNQVEGLLNGDVQFITGFRNNEPVQLRLRGLEPGLLTLDNVAPLPGPGIVTGDAQLAEDPGLVERFAAAVARAQAAVIEDPDAGVAAAVEAVPAIGEDVETATAVLDATAELWAGQGGFNEGRIDVERWTRAFALMQRLAFIDGSVPVEEMIAPEVRGGS